MNETCCVQEICPHYSNGSKRKVHHIRLTDVCVLFKDGKCAEQNDIKQGPACNIKKMKRLRGKK